MSAKLVHLAAIAFWAITGILFTFKVLFTFVPTEPIGFFWAWLLGYAVVTTLATRPLDGGSTVGLVHALAACGMWAIPRTHVLAPARLGLDAVLYLLPSK